MQVFDCFPFFNELDLLEIRLATLDPVVDHFVIVEMPRTFSNLPKPLFFQQNKQRFSKWLHKITHIVADGGPVFHRQGEKLPTSHRFQILDYQYGCCAQALTNVTGPAAIMVGDTDEIIRPEIILQAAASLQHWDFIRFRPECFIFYLNGQCSYLTCGPMMCSITTYREVSSRSPRLVACRTLSKSKVKTFRDKAGWHFTYLGGVNKIIYKLASQGHAEVDRQSIKNRRTLQQQIKHGVWFYKHKKITYVPLDASFPPHVLINRERFAHLIHPS